MSFIQVMLSHKEVLISLVVVVLIMFSAVGLAVAPTLSRRLKQASARRKAKREAQQAAELKKQRAAQSKSGKRKRAVVVANQQQPEADPSDVPVVAAEALPTAAAPAASEAAPAAPAAPVAAVTPPSPEAQPAASDAAGDIQDILNAVFVDEESNSRYAVLLRDVEPISAEELLEMATKVAAALRAAQQKAG